MAMPEDDKLGPTPFERAQALSGTCGETGLLVPGTAVLVLYLHRVGDELDAGIGIVSLDGPDRPSPTPHQVATALRLGADKIDGANIRIVPKGHLDA